MRAWPFTITRLFTRSGKSAARTTPASDVKLGAKIVARSHPTAFMTAIASLAQDSAPIMSSDGTREDSPIPRWSKRITRQKDARRR